MDEVETTGQQLMNDALAASEIRYRRLFETAKDGILILDAETGMIMDVNPFLINLLGYSKEEFIEKAVWEIGSFKDILANREKFIELQEQEYVRYDDLPLETAQGKKINVEFVSNVYLVNQQKVIQCNIRDITARKQVEFQVAFSTKILNLLNTTAPFNETIDHILNNIQKVFGFGAVGIRFKKGDDYPYYIQVGFSDAFLRTENTLWGFNGQGEVCLAKNGKPALECTCGLVISGQTDSASPFFTEGGSFWTNNSHVLLGLPSDADPRINPRNRCIHEEFLSIALIPIRNGGEIVGLLQLNDRKKDRFTQLTVKFFERIGEIIGVAFIRKQHEVALEQSRNLLFNLSEQVPGVIFQYRLFPDGHSCFPYASSGISKMFEVSPEEVREDANPVFERLHQTDLGRVSDMINESARTLQHVGCEFMVVLPTQGLRWRYSDAMPEHMADGSTLWHGIIYDITERKHAEKEIRKLNETLENRINERTAQLENTNKKLEYHLHELEQFGYITNHDLREPLRTLVQYTRMLKEEYSGKLDETGKKYVDFIHHSGLRMTELVLDLRDYALIGKEGQPAMVDCNLVVVSVLSDLEDSINESKAKITVQKLPVINGYETDIRMLFQNLVNNAIKFQKKDAIPEIEISVKELDKDWLFSVKDNGIGIDNDHLAKVFIIFQRLHKRSDYEGTGIGLAHCKKIVELHGGKIWIESIPVS